MASSQTIPLSPSGNTPVDTEPEFTFSFGIAPFRRSDSELDSIFELILLYPGALSHLPPRFRFSASELFIASSDIMHITSDLHSGSPPIPSFIPDFGSAFPCRISVPATPATP